MFILNGDIWHVMFVDRYSDYLIDRTGSRCLATTDTDSMTVYLSNDLSGNLLMRVLVHEIGHAALHSYGLDDELHRIVKPDMWIEAEEWVCNLIADYGARIMEAASGILANKKAIAIPELHAA